MIERKYETGFYWVKLMKDDKFEIAKCINHCGNAYWTYCGISNEALLMFKTENFSEIGDKIEIPNNEMVHGELEESESALRKAMEDFSRTHFNYLFANKGGAK